MNENKERWAAHINIPEQNHPVDDGCYYDLPRVSDLVLLGKSAGDAKEYRFVRVEDLTGRNVAWSDGTDKADWGGRKRFEAWTELVDANTGG